MSDFPGKALPGEDLWEPDSLAQAGPGPGFLDPIMSMSFSLTETQGECGGRGTEPESQGEGQSRGPSL